MIKLWLTSKRRRRVKSLLSLLIKGGEKVDPKKYFLCSGGKHIVNDAQRKYGKQSKCEQREIEGVKNEIQKSILGAKREN